MCNRKVSTNDFIKYLNISGLNVSRSNIKDFTDYETKNEEDIKMLLAMLTDIYVFPRGYDKEWFYSLFGMGNHSSRGDGIIPQSTKNTLSRDLSANRSKKSNFQVNKENLTPSRIVMRSGNYKTYFSNHYGCKTPTKSLYLKFSKPYNNTITEAYLRQYYKVYEEAEKTVYHEVLNIIFTTADFEVVRNYLENLEIYVCINSSSISYAEWLFYTYTTEHVGIMKKLFKKFSEDYDLDDLTRNLFNSF